MHFKSKLFEAIEPYTPRNLRLRIWKKYFCGFHVELVVARHLLPPGRKYYYYGQVEKKTQVKAQFYTIQSQTYMIGRQLTVLSLNMLVLT